MKLALLALKKEFEEELKLKEEEALVLDNFHEEKKVKENQKVKSQKPSVSPAARKMAAESKVDLNKIEGSGKHGYFKRRYYEFNGI